MAVPHGLFHSSNSTFIRNRILSTILKFTAACQRPRKPLLLVVVVALLVWLVLSVGTGGGGGAAGVNRAGWLLAVRLCL